MICNPLTAPWHKESFDRFLHEQLPELLAGRIPMEDYSVHMESEHFCSITIALAPSEDDGSVPIRITIPDVPCPDESGLFHIDDHPIIVVPVASSEDLELAEIKCVGELLFDYVEPRVGAAPAELNWDEALLRSWIPMDKWIMEFLTFSGDPRQKPYVTSQYLDTMNWISRHEHPRRLLLMNRQEFITPGQLGRICPVQTPEGPNIGRVLAIARGAVVKNGRLEIVDNSPCAGLSLTASLIPFLECDEPTRALMGTNMIRQWQESANPEPALVQTGFEPQEPGFWNGRNMLTAFMSLGESTFEDGIVISESAAKRLNWEGVIEPGDKVSNRHGTKGVISQIIPDSEMPHLQDGTPVELVFSFIGQHTRMNFGQLKEAVLGRIAMARGVHLMSKPFDGLDDDQIKDMLIEQQWDPSGMEILRNGASGEFYKNPTTVGYVYWGLTHHLSRRKVFARPRGYQRQGPAEYFQYRDIGAFNVIQDIFNIGSSSHGLAEDLVNSVSMGDQVLGSDSTPVFKDLQKRLAVAGIQAIYDGDSVSFAFGAPAEDALELACPVQHPWLPKRQITHVGSMEGSREFETLFDTNAQMKRVLNGHAPKRLLERSRNNLQQVVTALFNALIDQRKLCQTTRVVFSGRAVVAPGVGLKWDEVTLPEEIAWALFGPMAVARMGNPEEVEVRSDIATAVLDEVMADKWVIVNRAPSLSPTALLGFRPRRSSEKVVRLHPFCCQLLNADYDGDQVAVMLPITDQAQDDVKRKLSIQGHLERDPKLVALCRPTHEAMWGLAQLSRSVAGRQQISQLLGVDLQLSNEVIDTHMVIEGMRRRYASDGVEKMFQTAHDLFQLGFETAVVWGASHSPFGKGSERMIDLDFRRFSDTIRTFFDGMQNQVIAGADLDDSLIGPQLISVISGARGTPAAVVQGQFCQVTDTIHCEAGFIENGLISGLLWKDYLQVAAASRRRLGGVVGHYEEMGVGLWNENAPVGMNVLARAARLDCPGAVFASAAAIGEMDPLTDLDSRLFMGMMPIK